MEIEKKSEINSEDVLNEIQKTVSEQILLKNEQINKIQ